MSKLINDYIQDNELDLDKIIEDYSSYVYTIINNMVGNNLSLEDKEEIISDTFFIIWKNKSNNILKLDAYIAGITRNLIKEKIRKNKITIDIDDVLDFQSNEKVDMFISERLDIDKCLKLLNELDKKVFIGFYYQTKTAKEIARELNLTENNVSTKLSRIRKKIKKELSKGGHYNG